MYREPEWLQPDGKKTETSFPLLPPREGWGEGAWKQGFEAIVPASVGYVAAFSPRKKGLIGVEITPGIRG